MNGFLKKFKEIYLGWQNDAFPTDEILAYAEPRAKICSQCPLNINNTCSTKVSGQAIKTFVYQEELRYEGKFYNGCGCPLSKKTKSPESKCPIGLW